MDEYKHENRQAYDTYTDRFNEKFDLHFNSFVHPFANAFLTVLSGIKILDLGSGPGVHALYFKKFGYDITCLDISENMLALCRARGLRNIHGDIETFEIDEPFDGIWAYASLLHVPKANIHGAVERIARHLNHGGIAGIAVKEGSGECYVSDERYPGTKRWFAYYRIDEMWEILQEKFALIDVVRTTIREENIFLNYLLRLR